MHPASYVETTCPHPDTSLRARCPHASALDTLRLKVHLEREVVGEAGRAAAAHDARAYPAALAAAALEERAVDEAVVEAQPREVHLVGVDLGGHALARGRAGVV
eukprot:7385146-Prymnesium_polylepis.1